jgi:hypothetical protein
MAWGLNMSILTGLKAGVCILTGLKLEEQGNICILTGLTWRTPMVKFLF